MYQVCLVCFCVGERDKNIIETKITALGTELTELGFTSNLVTYNLNDKIL